ncbi:putative multi-domain containing protein [Aduncisulcus paluster]|uniref:Multi-domain containing protein n=1 Tax=Aduncisulcus paluster TaxID=2918883 RepID=A0ABQ5JTH9_9EUKA|nr:putative multi-domain containing protein [Aduncisulcus paluster]
MGFFRFKLYFILISFLIFHRCLSDTSGMRPVVLMHGINGNAGNMKHFQEWIQEDSPDTYVLDVELGNGAFDSIFGDITKWALDFIEIVGTDEVISEFGSFNLICHSQGNMFCLYYIGMHNSSYVKEQLPDYDLDSFPTVYNYMSIAAPAAGFFGDDDSFEMIGLETNDIAKVGGSIIYTPYILQLLVNPSGYWRDPMHLDVYRKLCLFLPILNNEISHPDFALNKQNRMSLNYYKMFGSPNDGVISPYQSTWYGYFKEGTLEEFVTAEETDTWENVGLKDLDEAGKLEFVDSGMCHTDYLYEDTGGKAFFEKEMKDYVIN